MKIAASHRILAVAGLCAAALVALVVAEGFALSPDRGVYQLAHMPDASSSATVDDVEAGDDGDEDEAEFGL